MSAASGEERRRARAATETGVAVVGRLRLGSEQVAVIAFPAPDLRSGLAVTAAEQEVVRGVLSGLTNAEIARQRHRSVRTVANQVAAALRKLRVGSRAELLAALIAGVDRPPR
ncbi:MAG: helix-turn-helix transcriptional regulator [Deltaproteobacteria bacterium]|nr:helix-turn-helix transcriptional regulator [Deltaproteobacteria bacterium]